MANSKYTEHQITEFLEIAQEIGITRTMRDLGYPKSWATAKTWADSRGIEVATDDLKARAAGTREWYKTEEILLVAQQGFNRVYEELVSNLNLTADDQKKLADALKKHYEVWASAQGKATNINENRSTETLDGHIQELINMERAKNHLKSHEGSEKS